MKRLLTYILVGLLVSVLVSPALAVDKKKTTKTKDKTEKVIKKSDTRTKSSSATSKKLQNFIDANKNGVDDRLERKATIKKTIKSKSTATKSAKGKPSVTKTKKVTKDSSSKSNSQVKKKNKTKD
ncbi:MAG: hypothetical protein KAT58_10430 [candidate division Zixibacteria bacterium]|nr:hypothetical protein [candidate division Zixibacteria bacterium]